MFRARQRHPDVFSVERQDHHRRRALHDRAGRGHQGRPHRRGRHQPGHRPARGARHQADRLERPVGHARADRQPHAPAARRNDLAMGSAAGMASAPANTRSRCCAPGRRRSVRANGSTTSAAGRSSSSPTTSGRSPARSWIRPFPTIRSCCRRPTARRISTAGRSDAMGIGDTATAPPNAAIVRDAAGKPTGRVLEAGFRQLVAKLPIASGAEVEASTQLMIKDLNTMGLTAFGSAGCEADVLPTFRKLADQGQLNVRVGCITAPAGRRQCGPAPAADRADEAVSGRQLPRSDLLRRERLRAAARPDVRASNRIRSPSSSRRGAASPPRLRRRACRCTSTRT